MISTGSMASACNFRTATETGEEAPENKSRKNENLRESKLQSMSEEADMSGLCGQEKSPGGGSMTGGLNISGSGSQ